MGGQRQGVGRWGLMDAASWSIVSGAALGLAGIGATVYATRLQARATLAQVVGERERQEAQHVEDHRRNRQNTYHLLLTAAAQLRAMRGEVALGTEEAERARWDFLHLLHGVELFGTEEVRQAAVRVSAALEDAAKRAGRPIEIFEAPRGYMKDKARLSQEVRALIDVLLDEEVADRMDDLLTAMRQDVAPTVGKPLESTDGDQRRKRLPLRRGKPAISKRSGPDGG